MKKVKVIKTDIFEDYAKSLKKSSVKLKSFQKQIVDEYNTTKDIAVFLENLKIVAMVKGDITGLAKKSNIQRKSVYSILSKDSNPSFTNITTLAQNLGIDFNFKVNGK